MTYFYFSLGCKVNSYECAAIASLLNKKGFAFTENNPNIVIINTCAVTSVAEQKSRQHIRKYKELYPRAIIVVMGCAVQAHKEEIIACGAHIIIGTSYRSLIPSLINEYLINKKPIVKVDDKTRFFKYEELGVTSCSENIRAYLKIQDGCDNFCSYCLIPFVRGKARSRNSKDVLNEAQELVKSGYQEIVVSGVDIGSFGSDTKDIKFSDLIEKLLSIPNLKRLRISSLEASQVDEKLLNLFKTKTNLVSHLHIPLQSGSETVLKRMNRKYDKSQFLSTINKLREARKDIALTTDVIVGFPGETDEEFLETKSFINECEFNMLHVFPYSSRKGTKAASLPNQVNSTIKKERVKDLISLSNKLWDKYTNLFLDKDIEVLFERYDTKNKRYVGHTGNYIEFSIESKENLIGKFVKVKYKK